MKTKILSALGQHSTKTVLCWWLENEIVIIYFQEYVVKTLENVNKMKVCFVLPTLLSFGLLANGEVYSSASDMASIFNLEKELVDIMNSYANKLETKLSRINSYLEVG